MKWIAPLIWVSSISYLGYYSEQDNFLSIIIPITIAFGSYLYILGQSRPLLQIIILGIIARVTLIPAFPNLSEDIFRYLWDGICWLKGISPYEFAPQEIANVIQRPDLLADMNSARYNALYPTIPQGIFGMAAWLSGGNVWFFGICLKVILLVADCGIIMLLKKIITQLGLPLVRLSWYILNPFLIIETFGNAHFELLMLLPVLWAIQLAINYKWWQSASALSLAVAAKLIPAMFGPIFLARAFKSSKALPFIIGGIITSAVILSPMLYSMSSISGLGSSADLFFRNFEFNASLYFVFRWIGDLLLGYNAIAWIGPGLSLCGLGIILYLSSKRSDDNISWIRGIFLISIVYLLFSTTVHPWYLILPHGIGCLLGNKTIYAWTYLVFLSYAFYDYGNPAGLWFVGIEYSVLAILAIWSIKK